MRDFRVLIVWRKAHRVVLKIYSVSEGWPQREMYGLTSQVRQAALSVPANIAEGCGRSSEREFKQYLGYAQGSASELEYQLLLAKDLRLIPKREWEEVSSDVVEVKKMLAGLINKLKADS
ncbi:MAG: four helix bundle protein [Anaerolineales bacterium]|nr:four helix bundle protein [Anaerolineales bacterium]